MSQENNRQESFGLHLGFKIAKLALRALSVAAAVCMAKQIHHVGKEIHKVHKALEDRK